MKRHFPFFILLFIVACTVNQAEPTPTPEMPVTTPTTVASPVPSATASLPTTNTIPLPTDTATSQPIVTDTPPPTAELTITPTLIEPIPEPTVTPYSGHLPSGHLYFLWDPSLLLPHTGRDSPIHNLYAGMLNDSTNEWALNALLTELIGSPEIALSPDETKYALTKIDDVNGDGFASQESVNRGFDIYRLYLFDLITQSLSPLHANIANPYSLAWLADNQTLAFRNASGLYLHSINELVTHQFKDASPDLISSAVLSPNKQLIGLNLQSAQIQFLDMNSGEVILTIDNGGFSIQATWSSDNEWFILPQGSTQQLLLINVMQSTVTPIIPLETAGLMAWSPMGATLALHQRSATTSQIVLIDPADLSITPVMDLPDTDSLIHLSWSPDGNSLLVGMKHERRVTLQMIDLATGSLRELWQGDNLGRFYIGSWSPDGQWVLAMLGQSDWPIREESSGLFFISTQNGDVYQLLDTSGTFDPYGFFWLP